jgi:hypothetical protein
MKTKVCLSLEIEILDQIKRVVQDSGIKYKNVTNFIQLAIEDKLAQK